MAVSVNGVVATFAHFRNARRLFWLAFIISLITQIIGRAWDSYWHSTHTFDGFFSPPHVFIYALTTINVVVLELLVFIPEMRCWFGPGFRLPVLAFEVPGALALLVGSYGVQAFGGLVLDNIWHTRFGLDETFWSLPHAMISWARLVGMLGFIACAIALHRHSPFSQYVTSLLGFFLFFLSVSIVLGPFYANNTPDTVQAISNMPILRAQPPFLHAYQIYLTRHLDRTSPLVAVLGALWSGMAIGFLRKLDARDRVLVTVAVSWSVITAYGDYNAVHGLNQYFPVMGNPAAWLPLPILAPVIVLIFLKTFRWRLLIAGWAFGLCIFLFWWMQPLTLLLTILAGPGLQVGVRIGERVYVIIDAPDRAASFRLLIGASIGIPIVLGLLDLFFRTTVAS